MAQRLAGKSALITGAGSGIGRTAALMFAAEGAVVTVADTNAEGGHETVRLVRDAGGQSQFVQTDVTSEDDVRRSVAAAVSHFGRLDCAMNNAGVTGDWTPLEDFALAEWERIIRINMTGVFLCMKHQIPAMLATGGGAIVNTSSGMALRGRPGMVAYTASKSGVSAITRVAAAEYGDRHIRVNAVLPGLVQTPMTENIPDAIRTQIKSNPLGRMAAPEEIASAALWLCSDEASFVNGQNLPVDAGWSIR